MKKRILEFVFLDWNPPPRWQWLCSAWVGLVLGILLLVLWTAAAVWH